jgi:hypothetical protein
MFCFLMEGYGSGAGSRSVQIIKDPDPGGLNKYGSYGSGSGRQRPRVTERQAPPLQAVSAKAWGSL